MNYPEQDQNQQHWEKMTSPAEEDRHPQLNCTVCGPKTGFSGCLCNAKNENGSDTDRSEDIDQNYLNGQEGVEGVEDAVFVDVPGDSIMTFFSTRYTGFLQTQYGFEHYDRGVTDEQDLAQALQELDIDRDEWDMTPNYMENQCEMEMSMSSSEMISRRSQSPAAAIHGIGEWIEGVRRENLVFAPLRLSPTDYPESIAAEDLESYERFGDM